jgi:hypothetical protein
MFGKNKRALIIVVLVLFVHIIVFYFYLSDNNKNQAIHTASQEFDYYQFKKFDLTKYDINSHIMLPDETAGIGTVFSPEMLHDEGSHLWQLQSGRNFIIFIEDLGELRDIFQDFKNNLTKSTAFIITPIVNKDSMMVYSRSLSKQYQKVNTETFHLFAVKQIDGRLYQFRNREEGNTKAEILFMQKSIESIK